MSGFKENISAKFSLQNQTKSLKTPFLHKTLVFIDGEKIELSKWKQTSQWSRDSNLDKAETETAYVFNQTAAVNEVFVDVRYRYR